MKFLRTLILACFIGSLSGCGIMLDGINAYGLKHYPDDYIFTKPDGTTYREWNLAKDRRSKLKEDSIYLRKFELNAFTMRDTASRRRTHMALTAANLKQIASRNQLTIFTTWFPTCGPSLEAYTIPTLKMLGQLKKQGIAFNTGQVAFVFGSVSYDLAYMDYRLNKWKFPFQSYIIPSPFYSEKIILKEIGLNRELLPEDYEKVKDDISNYKVFLLDKNGNVIDKVVANYDDAAFAKELDRFAKNIKASIL
ncbi:hypothetical protein [Adhaeribacter terreus]|uniref:Lipoprotein n=1 Tax=Adhaeribacter terreus TaxID=529703 RepID=A0ABW0ED34_9BACT